MAALVEVHARQLRALLEHLDVACGGAVTSTNRERGMRQRGREVEKSVGSGLSVTPKNEKFHRKSGLDRNLTRKFRRTLDFGASHVHLGQTRAAGENLDVTCTKNLIC